VLYDPPSPNSRLLQLNSQPLLPDHAPEKSLQTKNIVGVSNTDGSIRKKSHGSDEFLRSWHYQLEGLPKEQFRGRIL
jgi:hypothetical protein